MMRWEYKIKITKDISIIEKYNDPRTDETAFYSKVLLTSLTVKPIIADI